MDTPTVCHQNVGGLLGYCMIPVQSLAVGHIEEEEIGTWCMEVVRESKISFT